MPIITVTKTLAVTAQQTKGREIWHFTLDATYAETNSGWIKITGLPVSTSMRLLRFDMVSSVSNQVGIYNNDTTASQATEVYKAGSAATRNQTPAVSGAMLDSGIWFRTDSNGYIYCAPNLAGGGGDISRCEGFISCT